MIGAYHRDQLRWDQLACIERDKERRAHGPSSPGSFGSPSSTALVEVYDFSVDFLASWLLALRLCLAKLNTPKRALHSFRIRPTAFDSVSLLIMMFFWACRTISSVGCVGPDP